MALKFNLETEKTIAAVYTKDRTVRVFIKDKSVKLFRDNNVYSTFEEMCLANSLSSDTEDWEVVSTGEMLTSFVIKEEEPIDENNTTPEKVVEQEVKNESAIDIDSKPKRTKAEVLAELAELEKEEAKLVSVRDVADKLDEINNTLKRIEPNKSDNCIEDTKDAFKLDDSKIIKESLTMEEFFSKSIFSPVVTSKLFSTSHTKGVATLSGGTGVGKSHFCTNLMKTFVNGKYRGFFIIKDTFSPSKSQQQFLKYFEAEHGEIKGKLGTYLIAYNYALNNPDVIICLQLDEVNHADFISVLGPVWETLNTGDTGNGIEIAGQEIKKLDNLKIIMTQNTVDRSVDTETIAGSRRKIVVKITFDDIDISKLPNNTMKNEILHVNDVLGKMSTANCTELKMGVDTIFDYELLIKKYTEKDVLITEYCGVIAHLETILQLVQNESDKDSITELINEYNNKIESLYYKE